MLGLSTRMDYPYVYGYPWIGILGAHASYREPYGYQGHMKNGRRILHRGYIIGPTSVRTLGSNVWTMTVFHAFGSRRSIVC